MLDAVFNHIGDQSQWRDTSKHGENLVYKDWFHIQEFSDKDKLANPRSSLTIPLPLRAICPSLIQQIPREGLLLSVAAYWIGDADIDAGA